MENSKSKIISFEERKALRELNESVYEGSITMTMSGNTIMTSTLEVNIEHIEEGEEIDYLKDTLESLRKVHGWKGNPFPSKQMLNKPLTILYYASNKNEDEFLFQFVNNENMTIEQIGALLNICINAMEE